MLKLVLSSICTTGESNIRRELKEDCKPQPYSTGQCIDCT